MVIPGGSQVVIGTTEWGRVDMGGTCCYVPVSNKWNVVIAGCAKGLMYFQSDVMSPLVRIYHTSKYRRTSFNCNNCECDFFLTLTKIRMQYALCIYAITQLLNTQYAFKTRKRNDFTTQLNRSYSI